MTITAPAADMTSAVIDDDELPPELPGTYEYVRVKNLIPNPRNIRTDAAALPGIVANLTEDGPAALISALTIVPIPPEPGQPTPEPKHQNYLIIDGEQRYWSAIDASQFWIQAIIRNDMDGDRAATIAMLRQVHRSDPTAAQQAKGIEQLALDGMDDAEIAKQTGYSEPQVKAGRVAAALGEAMIKRTREAGLDLLQLAELVKFADDPETADNLIEKAKDGPHSFARAAQAAANAREEARIIAARRAELTEAGIELLKIEPSYYDKSAKARQVSELRGDNGALTADAHLACPGRAVYLGTHVYSDGTVRETAYCADWRKYGHKSNTGKVGGPMTDEQRADRKELIANNKEMDAANPVRREWLASALSGKTALKNADRFMAEMLTGCAQIYSEWSFKGRPMLDKLLNPEGKKRTGNGYVPAVASRDRLINLSLASVAAAIEGDVDRQSWRNPKMIHGQWLKFCADNGYGLGPVEQIIVDKTVKPRKSSAKAPKKAAAPAPMLGATTPDKQSQTTNPSADQTTEPGTVVQLPAAQTEGDNSQDHTADDLAA